MNIFRIYSNQIYICLQGGNNPEDAINKFKVLNKKREPENIYQNITAISLREAILKDNEIKI